jgi:acyl dehydratase
VTIKMYFEDISVGLELPAWTRRTDLMNWNRFAAVNDEFIYLHMDDEAGRLAMNEKGAFGMGNLRYAYLLNALRDTFGDEAEIREVGCAHRAINQKGDVLTVTAKVIKIWSADGENFVELAMDVVNQHGIGTCPGHGVVVLPSRTGRA